MWHHLSADYLVPLLADDYHYASQWIPFTTVKKLTRICACSKKQFSERIHILTNESHDLRWRNLRDIKAAAGRADEAVRRISEWLWHNVVGNDVLPREMPEPIRSHLAAVAEELYAIRRLADSALDYFPPHTLKLLQGVPLSREEYFLCRASGVHFGTAVQLGLSSFDDYYVYRMLCYQDDECEGYINIKETLLDPDNPDIRLRFGLAPEQCKRRHLRCEQRTFFQKYLPSVYARFSDN